MSKLRILVLAKLHQPIYAFLRHFLDELANHADIQIWDKDGWDIYNVLKIMQKRRFTPDFIFCYDFAYGYVLMPRVYGLNYTDIPKGVYYIDLQYQTDERRQFIDKNKIQLIFSPTKDFFFRTFPEFRSRFRWLPFSINPNVFRDWRQPKTIDFLMMGSTWKDWYPFRAKVLEKMKNVKGFVFHRHPFDPSTRGINSTGTFTGEAYAREINKAKIFLTCGTRFSYPVAKYFEVPACNTLLLATGNRDLADLGFHSGVNFVEANEENFYEMAMYYLHNEQERNRIALNGYNLVQSRHTNQVRAGEFIDTIKRFLTTGK